MSLHLGILEILETSCSQILKVEKRQQPQLFEDLKVPKFQGIEKLSRSQESQGFKKNYNVFDFKMSRIQDLRIYSYQDSKICSF